MVKQKKYILTLDVVSEVIDAEAKSSGETGHNRGGANPEKLKQLVSNLHVGESGVLNASKVINTVLDQQKTNLNGYENNSLERIALKLNDRRIAV